MSKKTISKLISCAAKDRASHLTITSRTDRFFLDYLRDDGQKRKLSWKKSAETDMIHDWRRLFNIAPGELTIKKYCRLSDGSKNFNFYLTIRPENDGEKLVIDLVEPPVRIWRLSQLGLQPDDKRELEKILKMKSGLILIASAPENGKSATLQAMLLALNNPGLSICLLNDYPTYEVPGINILSLNKTNWERARRHDYDIVLAENLEEDHNLEEAIITANTGRLVIGTIQTEDSISVLNSVLAASLPSRTKLDSLKMIIGQKLAKLKRKAKARPNEQRYIGLFEILKLTPELKKLLIDKQPLKLTAKHLGRSLEDDRKKKLKDGLI